MIDILPPFRGIVVPDSNLAVFDINGNYIPFEELAKRQSCMLKHGWVIDMKEINLTFDVLRICDE